MTCLSQFNSVGDDSKTWNEDQVAFHDIPLPGIKDVVQLTQHFFACLTQEQKLIKLIDLKGKVIQTLPGKCSSPCSGIKQLVKVNPSHLRAKCCSRIRTWEFDSKTQQLLPPRHLIHEDVCFMAPLNDGKQLFAITGRKALFWSDITYNKESIRLGNIPPKATIKKIAGISGHTLVALGHNHQNYLCFVWNTHTMELSTFILYEKQMTQTVMQVTVIRGPNSGMRSFRKGDYHEEMIPFIPDVSLSTVVGNKLAVARRNTNQIGVWDFKKRCLLYTQSLKLFPKRIISQLSNTIVMTSKILCEGKSYVNFCNLTKRTVNKMVIKHTGYDLIRRISDSQFALLGGYGKVLIMNSETYSAEAVLSPKFPKPSNFTGLIINSLHKLWYGYPVESLDSKKIKKVSADSLISIGRRGLQIWTRRQQPRLVERRSEPEFESQSRRTESNNNDSASVSSDEAFLLELRQILDREDESELFSSFSEMRLRLERLKQDSSERIDEDTKSDPQDESESLSLCDEISSQIPGLQQRFHSLLKKGPSDLLTSSKDDESETISTYALPSSTTEKSESVSTYLLPQSTSEESESITTYLLPSSLEEESESISNDRVIEPLHHRNEILGRALDFFNEWQQELETITHKCRIDLERQRQGNLLKNNPCPHVGIYYTVLKMCIQDTLIAARIIRTNYVANNAPTKHHTKEHVFHELDHWPHHVHELLECIKEFSELADAESIRHALHHVGMPIPVLGVVIATIAKGIGFTQERKRRKKMSGLKKLLHLVPDLMDIGPLADMIAIKATQKQRKFLQSLPAHPVQKRFQSIRNLWSKITAKEKLNDAEKFALSHVAALISAVAEEEADFSEDHLADTLANYIPTLRYREKRADDNEIPLQELSELSDDPDCTRS